uniref:mitochondrial RNA pseudouridine synthase Rpusd4 n=1 Tax=Ciona intestinalis TaxID=7719 RepID=UPI00005230E6|nr:mitochondrial RNA pseudouridine synthase Rpusd4 [Ciona intestinalis]|eukprot:XP_009861450.1 mitochondrial RNA pseudouridine synthase Rpusd4 [Ciona intestinalis]
MKLSETLAVLRILRNFKGIGVNQNSLKHRPVLSSYHTSYNIQSVRGLRNKSTSKSTLENEQMQENLQEFIRLSNKKVQRNTKTVSNVTTDPELNFTVSSVESVPDVPVEKKRETGMDIAVKMRRENRGLTQSIKSKHRGVDLLKPIDVNLLSDVRLTKLLRKNVIYADNKLVIFNKPYGLPMHDGDGTKQTVKNVLPFLSKMVYGINTDIPLHLCHRLDKNTTGITICSTDAEMADYVMGLFRQRRVLRKYLAVVVGEPEPMKGVVDMPMSESIVSATKSTKRHSRMIIKPDVRYDDATGKEYPLRNAGGHTAITHYRTIDTTGDLSLVELQPQTTVKHQLRVHMADGLSCPILGDHKYSRYGSLAPQVLPPRVLRMFNIPHSKSRYMPLHLHLQQVLIPGVLDGSKPNMVVGSRLPFHFSRTLNLLKMKPGAHEGWEGDHRPVRNTTAEPLRQDNDLYTDPTRSQTSETSAFDQTDDCEKVFRTRIKVKYRPT